MDDGQRTMNKKYCCSSFNVHRRNKTGIFTLAVGHNLHVLNNKLLARNPDTVTLFLKLCLHDPPSLFAMQGHFDLP